MKSTLLNMVAVLFTITLVASAAVGVVYKVTEGPIAAANENTKNAALKNVLPEFDKTSEQTLSLDGMPIKVYTAVKGDQTVGYAVESMTKKGFSGEVTMMVGFDAEGNVKNISVLKQNETPGLGTKMCDAGNPLLSSVKRISPKEEDRFKVKKEGGELDALTAATISSKAYYDAVARAYRAYCQVSGSDEVPEVVDPAVEAVAALMPKADAVKVTELEIDGMPIKVHAAIKAEQVVGYVVESMTDKGYGNDGDGGVIRMAVAYDCQGTLLNVNVFEISESLESAYEMCLPDNMLLSSAKAVSPADVKAFDLKADGGELDAVSGATVSSKAYYDAVARAYAAYTIAKEGCEAQKGGLNE